MKITFRTIVISLLALSIIVGCTQKKNPLGNESELEMFLQTLRDPGILEYCYSYEDSVANYSSNNRLIVGNSGNNTSITLLQFSNLPDSGFVLENNATLSIGIKGNYNAENIQLSLGLILQPWKQNEATWVEATKDSLWFGSWDDKSNLQIIESNYIYSDTLLTFSIAQNDMKEIIEGWINDNPLSYGLAVFTTDKVNDKYIEFVNKDNENGPKLEFQYREQVEDEEEELSYEKKAIYNTFINSLSNYTKTPNAIMVGNLPPVKAVVKFSIPDSFFVVPDSIYVVIDSKVTINKATLIMFPNKANCHFSPSNPATDVKPYIGIYPYHLIEEFPEESITPIPYNNSVLTENSIISSISVVSDSLVLDVTSLVQSYISDMKTNNGILLVSATQNKDNSIVRFYPFNTAEASKRPYLRIIYTKSPW